MKKAILFDLDGTLWDSSLGVTLSWNQALAPYDITITQSDVQGAMGKTLPEIAQLLFPQRSPEEHRQILIECAKEEEEHLRAHGADLFPGLIDTLETLSQTYDLAIVSNCQQGYIEVFLDHYGLRKYFRDWESAGRTGRTKGENIRMVLVRNGIQKAIYVGDTQRDCDAADFAGIPFVHAAYGFGSIDRPTPRITALDQLPALAETLFC